MTIRLGEPGCAIAVRDLRRSDLADVIRIDAAHTGAAKPEYWDRVLREFLDPRRERTAVGLATDDPIGLSGYLLGEVRAFEFGSPACGWVFAIGVDPARTRRRIASLLLAECCRRFARAGIACVRTMVLRDNVPVLSFFRDCGFVAGSFVQLELDLGEDR
ncbi:MAG TPA: GNAT family N-acetyltransferase [Candidatus Polarisedimenticolaceae bacterium]|nr:GNAT family N-acetyltransferase [Candidatus Polarisedimenticolaceae bacterium]